MDQDKIQQYIQSEVSRQLKAYSDGVDLPNHSHNGIDASRIPFPKSVIGTVMTTAIPTGFGKDGDIILTDIAGTRKINGRISGVWYHATLT